jgi:hypothetical protein
MNVMLTSPGHDLTKLALLHDTELIKELKLLVSIEPTPSVMSTPTGIPPHIELAKTMQQLLEMMTELMTVFRTQSDDLIDQVKQAIEEKAWDSGHVTGSRLKELLEQFQQVQMTKIDMRLVDMQKQLSDGMQMGNSGLAPLQSCEQGRTNNHEHGYYSQNTVTTFIYDGMCYGVPKNFRFPTRIQLKAALRFWLCGMLVSRDGSQRVQPFMNFALSNLPKNLRSPFKLNWKGLFKFLEDALTNVNYSALNSSDSRRKFTRDTTDVWKFSRKECHTAFVITKMIH